MLKKTVTSSVMNTIEKYLKAGCEMAEACSFADVSLEKARVFIKENYDMTIKEYKQHFTNVGNAELRLAQHDLAVKKKNPDMLKFLGTNRLGQNNKANLEIDLFSATVNKDGLRVRSTEVQDWEDKELE